MNFYPDTDSYTALHGELKSGLTELDDLSGINYTIDCESDISSELFSIESNIGRIQSKAQAAFTDADQSLRGIIEGALERAMEGYVQSAKMMGELGVYDQCAAYLDHFPFQEWLDIGLFKMDFFHFKTFFTALPHASASEMELYFDNAACLFKAVAPPSQDPFFAAFLTTVEHLQTPERDAFITGLLTKNPKLVSHMLCLHVKGSLAATYDPFIPRLHEALVSQCTPMDTGHPSHPSSSSYTSDSSRDSTTAWVNLITQIKPKEPTLVFKSYNVLKNTNDIDWDYLKAWASLASRLKVGLVNELSAKMVELVSRMPSKEQEQCHEFVTYARACRLTQMLSDTAQALPKVKI